MKTKRNTYLLLTLVITVWGIVIYKILKTTSRYTETVNTKDFPTDFRPLLIHKRDTFTISVHQRDPFSGKAIFAKRPKKIPSKKRTTSLKSPSLNIAVTFFGMIADHRSKGQLFFVTIDNNRYLMKINDEIRQVKLIKGNAKAIHIRYQNRLKRIAITP